MRQLEYARLEIVELLDAHSRLDGQSAFPAHILAEIAVNALCRRELKVFERIGWLLGRIALESTCRTEHGAHAARIASIHIYIDCSEPS